MSELVDLDLPAAVAGQPPCGINRIAAERRRQVASEGWTPEHDDDHDSGALVAAAVCYAKASMLENYRNAFMPDGWPWAASWWKPSPDNIRNLEKAGALIAAEIDRLLRLQGTVATVPPQTEEKDLAIQELRAEVERLTPLAEINIARGLKHALEITSCQQQLATARSLISGMRPAGSSMMSGQLNHLIDIALAALAASPQGSPAGEPPQAEA